jgi:hypothetical protein
MWATSSIFKKQPKVTQSGHPDQVSHTTKAVSGRRFTARDRRNVLLKVI